MSCLQLSWHISICQLLCVEVIKHVRKKLRHSQYMGRYLSSVVHAGWFYLFFCLLVSKQIFFHSFSINNNVVTPWFRRNSLFIFLPSNSRFFFFSPKSGSEFIRLVSVDSSYNYSIWLQRFLISASGSFTSCRYLCYKFLPQKSCSKFFISFSASNSYNFFERS